MLFMNQERKKRPRTGPLNDKLIKSGGLLYG